MIKQNLVILALIGTGQTALAVFDGHLSRGQDQYKHNTPTGNPEVCIIMQKLSQNAFTEKDKEQELKLCEYDFHGLTSVIEGRESTQIGKAAPTLNTQNVGLCPKLNSTNPGVLISSLPDKASSETFESSFCKRDDSNQNVKAKFKQTVSCSDTSSPLLNYHFSRLLGGIGRVPVAVIRTMIASRHKLITAQANEFLDGSPDLIAQNWQNMMAIHNSNHLVKPNIFDTTGEFVYGALLVNPKHEENYSVISGKGNYENRYQRFLVQQPYLNVASTKSFEDLAGPKSLKNWIQKLVQMKDVSDMVLLDTLLNQQDRIGNIHSLKARYSLDPQSGSIVRSKIDSGNPNANLGEFVDVEEMLLKDNDCGISKSNMMRNVSALEGVRHMSYRTYSKFLKLAKTFKSPSSAEYFKREFLLETKNYDTILANFKKAESILVGNCKSNVLKMDLDLETHFGPAENRPQVNCEGN